MSGMDKAVKHLNSMEVMGRNACDPMKLTQAVLNLAHAANIFEHLEEQRTFRVVHPGDVVTSDMIGQKLSVEKA